MSHYVDGFVIPVPQRKLGAYRAMAKKAGKIWREYGALDYKECVCDDTKPAFGIPFPKGMKAKSGEVVVFSWIVYKSKAHRDRTNKKIMKDPRLAALCDPKDAPFDANRMLYGGFKILVSA